MKDKIITDVTFSCGSAALSSLCSFAAKALLRLSYPSSVSGEVKVAENWRFEIPFSSC